MEIRGKPETDPAMVTQNDDGSLRLDYLAAVTEGDTVKRFNRKGGFHISKWQRPADKIIWHLDVTRPGIFDVTITYAANPEWAGQSYSIRGGGQELSGKVESTGDWYEYQTFPQGQLTLAESGAQTVEIHPSSEVPEQLMYFQAIELKPAGK